MRFFLDQNVDARVRRFFVERGHESWTADESGLSREADNNLTVYATEKKAVVITHDKEFSQRRRRHIVGQHIYLRCDEPDAIDVLEAHFDDFLPLLERYSEIYVAVSTHGFDVTHPNETW